MIVGIINVTSLRGIENAVAISCHIRGLLMPLEIAAPSPMARNDDSNNEKEQHAFILEIFLWWVYSIYKRLCLYM